MSESPSLLSSGLAVGRQVWRQGALWLCVYLFGYLRWDPRWLVPFAGMATALFLVLDEKRVRRRRKGVEERREARSAISFDDLPAWVVDPGAQRVEWANSLLRQLWPSLNEVIRRTLSDIEEDRRTLEGVGLRSLRFPDATLGSSVPRLTGVKVHRWPGGSASGRREVVMDLAVSYYGDTLVSVEAVPKVPLLPEKLVPTITAAVMNVSFQGTLRY